MEKTILTSKSAEIDHYDRDIDENKLPRMS